MKLKFFIQQILANDLAWRLIRYMIVQPGFVLGYHRKCVINFRDVIVPALKLHSPSNSVLNGPFTGMFYVCKEAVSSAFFPKILGSYESELHNFVDSLRGEQIPTIVDVGCAEGYYAVGFARMFPGSRVYAYDTNPRALELARANAAGNTVEDRIIFSGSCTPETLLQLASKGPGLIWCDTDGYETTLFSRAAIESLRNWIVVIETHEHIECGSSRELQSRFAATHDIESILSVDDTRKPYQYSYPQLEHYSLAQRRVLLEEGRPFQQEWLVMRPKIQSHSRA